MSERLGISDAVLFAPVAMFQIALAIGAPLGHHAWGGVHQGRLPLNFRINSGLAAIVLLFAASVVLAESTVISWSPVPEFLLTPTVWLLAGLMALNTAGNLASKSAFERWVLGRRLQCWRSCAQVLRSACDGVPPGRDNRRPGVAWKLLPSSACVPRRVVTFGTVRPSRVGVFKGQ